MIYTRLVELVSNFQGWCIGKGLDEDHGVMLLTSGDVDISGVEETMQLVKSLGQVHIRGRRFNMCLKKYPILCKCREVVKPDRVPLEVFPTGGGEP